MLYDDDDDYRQNKQQTKPRCDSLSLVLSHQCAVDNCTFMTVRCFICIFKHSLKYCIIKFSKRPAKCLLSYTLVQFDQLKMCKWAFSWKKCFTVLPNPVDATTFYEQRWIFYSKKKPPVQSKVHNQRPVTKRDGNPRTILQKSQHIPVSCHVIKLRHSTWKRWHNIFVCWMCKK